MRHWNRTVLIGNAELGEYLRDEIRRRWPEAKYPFHIEVVGDQSMTHLEVRVWNTAGIQVVQAADPGQPATSKAESPTVAAVLSTVESAMAEARRLGEGDGSEARTA